MPLPTRGSGLASRKSACVMTSEGAWTTREWLGGQADDKDKGKGIGVPHELSFMSVVWKFGNSFWNSAAV